MSHLSARRGRRADFATLPSRRAEVVLGASEVVQPVIASADGIPRHRYACLNTILRKEKPPVFCSRTCRIDTILKEDKGMPYLKELGRQNTLDLIKLIEWNAAHHIYFLRGASCLVLLRRATRSA